MIDPHRHVLLGIGDRGGGIEGSVTIVRAARAAGMLMMTP